MDKVDNRLNDTEKDRKDKMDRVAKVDKVTTFLAWPPPRLHFLCSVRTYK